MKLRKKLRKKKLDFYRFNPENDDTESWLGEKLVKEGNALLNNDSIDRNKLVIRCLILENNCNLASGEVKELEEKNRKLQVEINLSRKD